MLISVSHSMAIMSLQTHIIHWRKLKKIHRKMFSQTNYMKQDSTKNIWPWRKLFVFLNTCVLCNSDAIQNINIKARVKNIIPSLF